MSFGMNRVELIGGLGADVTVNHLMSGRRVASLSIATDESHFSMTGERVDRTEWHRIVVYGPTVAAVETMLRKGDAVMVEGRIATREYRDREDVARTITEIVVTGRQGMVNVLSGRRGDPGPGTGTGAAG